MRLCRRLTGIRARLGGGAQETQADCSQYCIGMGKVTQMAHGGTPQVEKASRALDVSGH